MGYRVHREGGKLGSLWGARGPWGWGRGQAVLRVEGLEGARVQGPGTAGQGTTGLYRAGCCWCVVRGGSWAPEAPGPRARGAQGGGYINVPWRCSEAVRAIASSYQGTLCPTCSSCPSHRPGLGQLVPPRSHKRPASEHRGFPPA